MGKAIIRMSQKGGGYEREFCKELSLWWTNHDRDDVFWRSSQSGGRATTRRKQGKSTANSYGDIAATDAIGHPLIDLITFELKRGYKESGVDKVLDRAETMKAQPFDEFLTQTVSSATDAGTPFWALITRRDRRRDMIWIPYELYQLLNHENVLWDEPGSGIINLYHHTGSKKVARRAYFCDKEAFFSLIEADDVKEVINDLSLSKV